MSTNNNFQESSHRVIERTPVWEYFLREQTGELAKCKKCQKLLKTTGGSTSSLHKHMSSIHSVVIKSVKRPPPDSTTPLAKRNTSSITNYLTVHDNSLEAVLARMTAGDGLPFRIFATSVEMRKSLASRGFEVPKSANTIRDMVMKYGQSIRQKYKIELQGLKLQGKQFSLSFDEWTSTKNRRYLNVNVHIKSKFWNL